MDASEDPTMNDQMTGDCPNQERKSRDLNSDGEEVGKCELDYSTSFKLKKEFGKEHASSSADLRPENAKLFTFLQKYKEECTKLQGQVRSLTEELRAARSEVAGLEEEKEDLTRCLCRDTMEAQRLLEEKSGELADLTNRYKKETLLLCDLKAQLSSTKAEMEYLVGEHRQKSLATEKELDHVRNDRDRLGASYQSVKEENVRLKAKVDALSERVGSLQNDVMYSSSQWEARNLEEENQSKIVLALEMMEAQHKTTTEDLERRNSELQEALAKTKDQLKVSELQQSILEEDMVRFQNLISSLQDKVFVAEARHQKAEEMVLDLIESKAALKDELELVEEKLEAEKETKREADGKITDLLDQVKKTEQVLIKTKDHVSKQAEEMEDLTKHKCQLEDAIPNLEAGKLKLEQRVLKKKNRIETLEVELKDSKQENENLKHQISETADDNIRLKEILQESQDTHSKEGMLKKLWQEEVVSRSMLGLRVALIEREKQAALDKLKREMRKQKSVQRLKDAVDRELKLEQQRNMKLRRKANRLKTRLALAQKEKTNVLKSMPTKMAVMTKDSASHIQKQEQLDDVTLESKAPLHRHRILPTDSQKLRDLLLHLGHQDLEPRQNPAEMANGQISNKTIDTKQDDRTFHALNLKLEEINEQLVEQAAAREESEKLRSANYAAVRAEFQRIKGNLKSELSRLRKENLELELERDSAIKEAEKFQKLYKDQRTQHLDTLAALEAAKKRLFKRQLQ